MRLGDAHSSPAAVHRLAESLYRVAFRKKVYGSLDELQADLDVWMREYNELRPHQGRCCFSKRPMQTFLDAMPMTKPDERARGLAQGADCARYDTGVPRDIRRVDQCCKELSLSRSPPSFLLR